MWAKVGLKKPFSVIFHILRRGVLFLLMVQATEIFRQAKISKFKDLGIGLSMNDFFG